MLAVPLLDLLMAVEMLHAATAWRMTLVVVFLNSIGCVTAQNSMYSLGALAGDNATQALQTGSGIIGVVSVVMRAMTKLGLPERLSMWLFCSGASVLLLLSLLSYRTIIADPQVAEKMARHEADRRRSTSGLAERLLPTATAPARELRWSDVLRHVWREAFAAFLAFAVCLACFPGLSTTFASHSWGLGSWFPLVMVALYNSGDLIGKALPARVRLIRDNKQLLCWVAAHVFFVPIFLLLLQVELFIPDLLPMLLVLFLGICTGYIGCMAFVLSSEQLPAELVGHDDLLEQHKARSGSFISFA